MNVHDVMTDRVESCQPWTDLGEAAMVMWRNDCGAVPVQDPASGKLQGVITDRDICMALATTGRRPGERVVSEVMATQPLTVHPDDDIEAALETMRRGRVRRLPVVSDDGKLVGMLSINDLILRASKLHSRTKSVVPADDVLETLKAICRHRQETAPKEVAEALVQV